MSADGALRTDGHDIENFRCMAAFVALIVERSSVKHGKDCPGYAMKQIETMDSFTTSDQYTQFIQKMIHDALSDLKAYKPELTANQYRDFMKTEIDSLFTEMRSNVSIKSIFPIELVDLESLSDQIKSYT